MDERWNLDRKPSLTERVMGICGALLLCAAGMASLWFSAFVKCSVPASLVTGTFTVLAVFFLYRFIFTAGRKLQRPGILATAVVFTVAGAAMLVASFFVDQVSDRLYLLSFGASGVGGGMLNFLRAKKGPIQPLQPTPP